MMEEMAVFPVWQKANSRDRKIIVRILAKKHAEDIIKKVRKDSECRSNN